MSESGYIRDGLCSGRMFSNASQIISGFLKSWQQAWGMELEKVTEKKQTSRRLTGDELKCRRELSMPSGFPFLLITEALSVCFFCFLSCIFFQSVNPGQVYYECVLSFFCSVVLQIDTFTPGGWTDKATQRTCQVPLRLFKTFRLFPNSQLCIY